MTTPNYSIRNDTIVGLGLNSNPALGTAVQEACNSFKYYCESEAAEIIFYLLYGDTTHREKALNRLFYTKQNTEHVLKFINCNEFFVLANELRFQYSHANPTFFKFHSSYEKECNKLEKAMVELPALYVKAVDMCKLLSYTQNATTYSNYLKRGNMSTIKNIGISPHYLRVLQPFFKEIGHLLDALH